MPSKITISDFKIHSLGILQHFTTLSIKFHILSFSLSPPYLISSTDIPPDQEDLLLFIDSTAISISNFEISNKNINLKKSFWRQKTHPKTGVDSTPEMLCKNNLDNGLSPVKVYYYLLYISIFHQYDFKEREVKRRAEENSVTDHGQERSTLSQFITCH